MTLTLDLQTLFKVTVHPLPKGTLWEKDELGREKICSGQSILEGQTNGRMDGCTNRQNDHFTAGAEQGPNKK